MRYYLAGGAVRDVLLGLAPQEFDIVFDGTMEDFLRQHPGAVRVGKTTPVFIVNGCDHTPLCGTVRDDIMGRDLTINALLLDANGIIHALPQTFDDLRNGRIRHTSPEAFAADPVRAFRAARFSATLPGFSIEADTVCVMRQTSLLPGFAAIAPERVGKECMRAMAGHTPGNFLRALAEAACLEPWFTPLEIARHIPAGPVEHHGGRSVFDHTCDVMDAVAAMPDNAVFTPDDRAEAVWMALCHDLGKVLTENALLPRHIGHEKRGGSLAESLALSLRLPNRWVKAGILAAALHMKGGQYRSLRPGTRVDLLHALVTAGMFTAFCALVMADAHDDGLAAIMTRDRDIILSVKLPTEWRDKGPDSAKKLRELRVRALA